MQLLPPLAVLPHLFLSRWICFCPISHSQSCRPTRTHLPKLVQHPPLTLGL